MVIDEQSYAPRSLAASKRFLKDFAEYERIVPNLRDMLDEFVKLKRTSDDPYGRKDTLFAHGDFKGFRHAHLVHGKVILFYQTTPTEIRLISIDNHDAISGANPRGRSLGKYLQSLSGADYTPITIKSEEPEGLTAEQKEEIETLFWELASSHREALETAAQGDFLDVFDYTDLLIDRPIADEDKRALLFASFGKDGLVSLAKDVLSKTSVTESTKYPKKDGRMEIRDFITIVEGVTLNNNFHTAAFCAAVAEAYEAAPAFDPAAKKAWVALNKHNVNVLFKRVSGSGVRIEFSEDDVYAQYASDPKMMVRYMLYDMVFNKRLIVYSGHSDHPVFKPEENVIFRTVHDYFTHGKLRSVFNKNFAPIVQKIGKGRLPSLDEMKDLIPTVSLTNHGNIGHSFTLRGELNSLATHVRIAPDAAAPALFTEVGGQVCYLAMCGDFPPQKVAILHGFNFQKIGETVPGTAAHDRVVSLMAELSRASDDTKISLKLAKRPEITKRDFIDAVKR